MDKNWVDSEFKEAGRYFAIEGRATNSYKDTYLNVLNGIVGKGVMQGQTANSLQAFAGIVETNLGTALADLVNQFATETDTFVARVFTDDEAQI